MVRPMGRYTEVRIWEAQEGIKIGLSSEVSANASLCYRTVPKMATPENLVDVTTNEHFQEQLGKDLARVSLVNFWASWAEPCKQMNAVVAQLAVKYPTLLVLQVSASPLHGRLI